VRTVNRTIRLPRVILLNFFRQTSLQRLKLTRNNVFDGDKNQCQYCGNTISARS